MMGTVYFAVLITTGCLVTALRDVRVTVPKAVRRGDSVVLHCLYDLEGDPLYSVKWYKGRAEFYRYTPKEKPPMKIFPVPGLSDLLVDATKSNETQLFLRSVTGSLTGQYNCEVSADQPSFHTALVAANMEVVEVPVLPPSLSGVGARYRVRDTLRANCTASPSKPAVNLTWGLNGENVNPKWVKQYRQVPEKFPDLQQSMSILEVPLRPYHFRRGGSLKVRCTASLYDLYWQTTERSVEEEGRANMAADNEVMSADKAGWDDYDDEYDDESGHEQSQVILGEFPTPFSREEANQSPSPSTRSFLWPSTVLVILGLLLGSLL